MEKKVTHKIIMQALNWSYDKAVNGVPGLDSATELAESYRKKGGNKFDQTNSLIRWQNSKSAISGCITNLGGITTSLVAIPANISSVIFIQIRMIAAIAYIGGYDPKDDQVKTMVYACLTGNAAKEILKEVGIKIGEKMAINAIKGISGKTLTSINQKVEFRLLTKFGEKGVINFNKTIPIIGGVIGATFDCVTTNAVGNAARDLFIE